MRYAIIVEHGLNNCSAYAPDLPGCVAAGKTVEETVQLMREAVDLHIKAMREDGDPIPPPTCSVAYAEVAA